MSSIQKKSSHFSRMERFLVAGGVACSIMCSGSGYCFSPDWGSKPTTLNQFFLPGFGKEIALKSAAVAISAINAYSVISGIKLQSDKYPYTKGVTKQAASDELEKHWVFDPVEKYDAYRGPSTYEVNWVFSDLTPLPRPQPGNTQSESLRANLFSAMQWLGNGRQTQPDQGATQPDQGATQPDQGATQPDQGATQPDQGATQPDQGATQPDQGATQPDQGATQPDQGATQPDQGRIHYIVSGPGGIGSRLEDFWHVRETQPDQGRTLTITNPEDSTRPITVGVGDLERVEGLSISDSINNLISHYTRNGYAEGDEPTRFLISVRNDLGRINGGDESIASYRNPFLLNPNQNPSEDFTSEQQALASSLAAMIIIETYIERRSLVSSRNELAVLIGALIRPALSHIHTTNEQYRELINHASERLQPDNHLVAFPGNLALLEGARILLPTEQPAPDLQRGSMLLAANYGFPPSSTQDIWLAQRERAQAVSDFYDANMQDDGISGLLVLVGQTTLDLANALYLDWRESSRIVGNNLRNAELNVEKIKALLSKGAAGTYSEISSPDPEQQNRIFLGTLDAFLAIDAHLHLTADHGRSAVELLIRVLRNQDNEKRPLPEDIKKKLDELDKKKA